jgi:hypothetical protein
VLYWYRYGPSTVVTQNVKGHQAQSSYSCLLFFFLLLETFPYSPYTRAMESEDVKRLIEREIRAAVAEVFADQPDIAVPPPGAAAAAVAVNTVAVKLPDFWTSDPDMWFFQAECAFNRSRITASYTKFEYVVMKLPEEVVVSVRSLLLAMDPASLDAYEQLKTQLTSSYGKSRWQRGFALLDHPELGDRRPSHMMAAMLALLPPGGVADTLFLCLFLRRLPAGMRDHLAAADFKTAAEMSAHADLLWDARAGQSVAAVAAEMMPVYTRSSSPRDSQRSSSPPLREGRRTGRRRPTPHSESGRLNPGFCKAHSKFGAKAYYCTAPCSWEED